MAGGSPDRTARGGQCDRSSDRSTDRRTGHRGAACERVGHCPGRALLPIARPRPLGAGTRGQLDVSGAMSALTRSTSTPPSTGTASPCPAKVSTVPVASHTTTVVTTITVKYRIMGPLLCGDRCTATNRTRPVARRDRNGPVMSSGFSDADSQGSARCRGGGSGSGACDMLASIEERGAARSAARPTHGVGPEPLVDPVGGDAERGSDVGHGGPTCPGISNGSAGVGQHQGDEAQH